MNPDPRRERLYELLNDRALVGLDRHEELELIELFALFPDLDIEEIDRVAAACALAAVEIEEMPAGLADKLAAQAPLSGPRPADTLVQPMRITPVPSASRPATTLVMAERPRAAVVPLKPKRNLFAASGWIAAAAILILAVGAFAWKNRGPEPLTAQRAALVAKAGTTTVVFAPTGDPASVGASGDVVWNAAEQKGFMRLKGLAKNDPKTVQYQLWIFDKDRDDKYPVDGGVFDVDGDDVIVPIKAQLAVEKPVLFAVTAEKPGGVVVSKRERIVIAAKPAT